MKKIILTTAVVLAMSSLAIAANVDITTKGLTFKPSNNVTVSYAADTNQTNYVVNSKHTAGDRIFSSSNNVSAIFYKSGTAGTPLVVASEGSTTPGDSSYGSGWSSQ